MSNFPRLDSTGLNTLLNRLAAVIKQGHTIKNTSGTVMTQRESLKFNGLSVTDDSTNNQTVIDGSSKADKVSNATAGDVATLNASGNLVDSGKTLGKSVPSDAVFTDTKNTAGSTDTGSKIYLIGATSQAANPQTYSQDTAFVGTDGCLYSDNKKVLTDHQSISGKADKVSNATSGNFAGLDANGNLTDSGKKPGDLLTLGTSSSTAYRGDRGNTAYTHATETRLTTATAQGLYKVGSTAQGHISGLTAVAKSDITALGIPAQDTTYESKSASSGGTAVSLCTTGEKYTWNNKQNALSSMSQSEADTGTSTTGRIITAKVLTDSIHKKAHTMYGVTQLSSSANLNSYTVPTYSGEYYYPIHGHSISNLPTGVSGKPFRLVVESLSNKDANLSTGSGDLDYSSANCTLQTLIVSDIAGTPSVKTYRRHYLNSTWSAWVSYEDEIASLNSRLVDVIDVAASQKVKYATAVWSSTNVVGKAFEYNGVLYMQFSGFTKNDSSIDTLDYPGVLVVKNSYIQPFKTVIRCGYMLEYDNDYITSQSTNTIDLIFDTLVYNVTDIYIYCTTRLKKNKYYRGRVILPIIGSDVSLANIVY